MNRLFAAFFVSLFFLSCMQDKDEYKKFNEEYQKNLKLANINKALVTAKSDNPMFFSSSVMNCYIKLEVKSENGEKDVLYCLYVNENYKIPELNKKYNFKCAIEHISGWTSEWDGKKTKPVKNAKVILEFSDTNGKLIQSF